MLIDTDSCSGLGLPCQSHRNCYIKDSFCVTGFCACTLNYHANPRNDVCIPNIGKRATCYIVCMYLRNNGA